MIEDTFDIPNRHGLQAQDFEHDMQSYRTALGFLGDVSCGTLEKHALAIEGGSPEMTRAWESSSRFRRALGKCREEGDEERVYAEQKAQRQSDPFAAPPGRGMTDLAAETFDPRTEKRPGALSRFLRRLGVEIDWQHAQREEPRPSGQRDVSLDAMADRDWAGVRAQNAEALRRAQAEKSADEQPWGGPQAWDRRREHVAPDGSSWQGAPASGGGLFTAHGDPDSMPTP